MDTHGEDSGERVGEEDGRARRQAMALEGRLELLNGRGLGVRVRAGGLQVRHAALHHLRRELLGGHGLRPDERHPRELLELACMRA